MWCTNCYIYIAVFFWLKDIPDSKLYHGSVYEVVDKFSYRPPTMLLAKPVISYFAHLSDMCPDPISST